MRWRKPKRSNIYLPVNQKTLNLDAGRLCGYKASPKIRGSFPQSLYSFVFNILKANENLVKYICTVDNRFANIYVLVMLKLKVI